MNNKSSLSILQVVTSATCVTLGGVLGGTVVMSLMRQAFSAITNETSPFQIRLIMGALLFILGYGIGIFSCIKVLKFQKYGNLHLENKMSNILGLILNIGALWFLTGILFGSGFVGSIILLMLII